MSANQFAEMIARMYNKKADVIPEGFKTSKEWSKLHKVTQSNVHRILVEALDMGLMEERDFNIIQKSGLRSIKHYKIIKTK
jgi:hypothetical protein